MGQRFRRGVAATIVLMLFVAVGLWFLTEGEPEWYAPPRKDDPAVVDLADLVEFRVVEEIQRVRDTTNPEPWTLRVEEHQVNAWLVARLPEWLEHEHGEPWPEQLRAPQVHLHPDGIHLAIGISNDALAIDVPLGGGGDDVRAQLGDRPEDRPDVQVGDDEANDDYQVFGLIIAPSIDDEGQMRLRATHVTVGRLSLPVAPLVKLRGILEDLVDANVISDSDADWIIDLLSGNVAFEPSMELVDDRRVRLTRVESPAIGVLDLTCETLGHADAESSDGSDGSSDEASSEGD